MTKLSVLVKNNFKPTETVSHHSNRNRWSEKMTVPNDMLDGLGASHGNAASGAPHYRENTSPRRDTLLHAALSSGLCLDLMLERMLDRTDGGQI